MFLTFVFYKNIAWFAFVLLLASSLPVGQISAQELKVSKDQMVFGAGPSTKIAQLFFKHFSQLPEADGLSFTVPQRSTKHAGGILASGNYLFGRLGRLLSASERAQNKAEIILANIRLSFVGGSRVMIKSLKPSQLDRILTGEIDNWRQLGGVDAPIILVGREKTEAVLSELRKSFPVLDQAKYHQVFKRDHTMVNFLSSSAGRYAIGFGSLSNFEGMNVIDIEGHELSMPLGLVFDLKNRDDPVIRAVRRYAASPLWYKLVRDAGYGEPKLFD